ncbi:hypothetical protein B0T25DRAFT_518733 [Lasiosphaeria hispida]|uniref:Uncharacterized protein n=1 Tax=Lasiosphaeria hispida TaxID=260671 RepID=A0AAJ0HJ97_9PEZI|nr:hypothetical protein B0T25DRAFT_518733 [Lasiosphaeria hispida]
MSNNQNDMNPWKRHVAHSGNSFFCHMAEQSEQDNPFSACQDPTTPQASLPEIVYDPRSNPANRNILGNGGGGAFGLSSVLPTPANHEIPPLPNLNPFPPTPPARRPFSDPESADAGCWV